MSSVSPRNQVCRSQSYPDEQLRDDHIALAAGEVQRVASVSLPAGLVDLLSGTVGEQQDNRAQVLLGRCPQQLLAQREVSARQRRQEQALLVLRPDPALPLLPGRQNIGTEKLSVSVVRNRSVKSFSFDMS